MNDRDALLEAARLLRLRAEAAPPGRWYSQGMDPLMDGSHRYHQVETAANIAGSRIIARATQPFRGWDVEHVAGLDPEVAVSMAELFEVEASKVQFFGHPSADNRPGPSLTGPSPQVIALARTYLRESSGG